MKTLKIICYTFLFVLLGCVASSEVSFDFDETADFEKYSTFVICLDDLYVENTNYPNYDNNAVGELVAHKVESQMIKKGHKTNIPKPELQAGFQLIVQNKEATFTNCQIQDEYIYWRECTIDTEIYTEETLVVYVSDLSRNQIIWQASLQCDMIRSKGKLPEHQ